LKDCTDDQQKATLEQLLKEHEDHLTKTADRSLAGGSRSREPRY
jgi:hypothetical protein